MTPQPNPARTPNPRGVASFMDGTLLICSRLNAPHVHLTELIDFAEEWLNGDIPLVAYDGPDPCAQDLY